LRGERKGAERVHTGASVQTLDMVADQTARTPYGDDNLDEAVEAFVNMRPRLMAIGYRFLANRYEAEDVVQETWLRWQRTDRTVVVDPPALLATMATRLAINVSQSAWRRREACMSPTGPEAADTTEDPATRTEHLEAVEQAVLVIMESLLPRERAAFVLREAFGYPYGRISELLHLGPVNTRQLVSRARKRLGAERRATVTSAAHHRFLGAFLKAARTGDLTGLEHILTADLAA